MSSKDKFQYVIVSQTESKQILTSDFIFQFGSDFNSFLKSADINVKLNKTMVHIAISFFVAGLFLLKFLL